MVTIVEPNLDFELDKDIAFQHTPPSAPPKARRHRWDYLRERDRGGSRHNAKVRNGPHRRRNRRYGL